MKKNINKTGKIKIHTRIEILELMLVLLFWICIFLSVRWCSFKCISDLKIIELIFVSDHETDSAMLNIVTGYVTGYLVYYFTTRRPTKQKKKHIREWADKQLMSIYNRSVYLLIIMCKCTATEEEWKQVAKDKDLECFNSKFYEIIKLFDLKKDAYTLFKYNETGKILSWGYYLYQEYLDMHNKLKDIYLQYGIYLENDSEIIIQEIMQCHYIETFLGGSINSTRTSTGSKDGKTYYDEIPIHMFYTQGNNLTPIFGGNNNGVDNSISLINYVELLHKLYDYLKVRIHDMSSVPDYSIKKVNRTNVGTYSQARFVNNQALYGRKNKKR